MRRESVAIREVYSLLRRIVGPSIPAKEVLNFAAAVVQFFAAKTDYELEDFDSSESDPRIRGRSFEEWPVDAAMADGGWNILDYEYSQIRDEQREFGFLNMEGEGGSIQFKFPAGVLCGDQIHAESFDWLRVDKQAGQLAGKQGWAVDEPGVRFYGVDFDDL